MIPGLAFALCGAVATSIAFLLEHRGAVAAAPVDARHPLRSAAGLFRSRWFMLGWGVAAVAWALHVGALALAPLSVAQAVYAGGIVSLAVLAERWFGFRLGRRQWIGIVVTAAGLAIVGITTNDPSDTHPHALAALIALEGGAFAGALGLVVASRTHPRLRAREGLLLGAAAGALFGVANVAIKYLTDAVTDGILELVSPWTATAAAAGILAFYISARALQLGPGLEVIAIIAVAANLTAIAGGVLVFRDTVGADALAIIARMSAFCLVLVGAALMPAPVRASPALSEATGD